MMEIPLGSKVAIIDDADAHLVTARRWYFVPGKNGKGYAASKRTLLLGIEVARVYLHRLILGVGENEQVDHIDGDGLNNRRANLRLATASQNQANRPPHRNNKSGFKGVSRYKRTDRYRAVIKLNGGSKLLGVYATAVEAALAYDRAAEAAWGKFAYLNFPPNADRQSVTELPSPFANERRSYVVKREGDA